ncbi:MAG: YIP1 family protein [bacterium]
MDQESVSATEVAQEKDSGLSTRGIWEVFLKPTAFFEKLRTQPKVLVPYLALAVVWVVTLFLMQDLIWDFQKNSPQFQEQLQGQALSPQIEQFSKISILVGGTIAMLLVPLIVAAMALFFGNFVFAGRAKFKTLLSVCLYGEILYAIGSLIIAPLMLAKGSILVSLSAAVLAVDLGPQSAIYVALSKISVFHIWEIIVVGIGLAIAYQFPRNKGYLLSVLSIGSLLLLHVILVATGMAAG